MDGGPGIEPDGQAGRLLTIVSVLTLLPILAQTGMAHAWRALGQRGSATSLDIISE